MVEGSSARIFTTHGAQRIDLDGIGWGCASHSESGMFLITINQAAVNVVKSARHVEGHRPQSRPGSFNSVGWHIYPFGSEMIECLYGKILTEYGRLGLDYELRFVYP